MWTLPAVTLLAIGCASERAEPTNGHVSASAATATNEHAAEAAAPGSETAAPPTVEPIRADSPANAMLELAVRAEAAGAAAAGQGPCEAALASATALTQAVPGNRPPPDREAFLAACETLPEGARPLALQRYVRVEGLIDHPVSAVLQTMQARVLDDAGRVLVAHALDLAPAEKETPP